MNTKITDLSLANNRIKHIQGLDSLKNLQTLSLSNNCLTELDELYYLRKGSKSLFLSIS